MARNQQDKIPGNGRCYVCPETNNLTFVSWYPVKPTEANDWKSKGADLCTKHDLEATSNYIQR